LYRSVQAPFQKYKSNNKEKEGLYSNCFILYIIIVEITNCSFFPHKFALNTDNKTNVLPVEEKRRKYTSALSNKKIFVFLFFII
jgi:hypothetical protein